MDKPAIDNLDDPTKPEVYYFDDNVREQVLAKQAALKSAEPAKAAPAKKTTKKAAKKKG